MATRATTQTSTRRRNQRATPAADTSEAPQTNSETPDTKPADTSENPETTAADTSETPAQTEMEGGEFDPRKAELLSELVQLTETMRRMEFQAQTSFIVDFTDDELEAFKNEVEAEINTRKVQWDFGSIQSLVSDVLANQQSGQ